MSYRSHLVDGNPIGQHLFEVYALLTRSEGQPPRGALTGLLTSAANSAPEKKNTCIIHSAALCLLHSDYGTNVKTRWIATETIYRPPIGSMEREVATCEGIPVS